MDCRILRLITLKSNGHIVCDDSSGYGIILGEVSPAPNWNIRQVIEGPVYRHVRRSFQEERPPWPGICETCHTFSPGGIANDTLDSRIRVMVEPTLACNLRCPSCMRVREGKTRSGDWDLDPKIFETFLRSCAKNDIAIEEIQYLGWGEPLLYSEIGTLTRLVRKWHPDCLQEITTSGSIPDPTVMDRVDIDKLTISCDGARPESYVKYRRSGDLDQVFALFEHLSTLKTRPVVEWKYILFEHNDSDDEIQLSQNLAKKFNVDSLLYIITNSKKSSRRYTIDKIKDFPFQYDRAHISPAASLLTIQQTGIIAPEYSSLGDGEKFSFFLDQAHITTSNVLELRGWCLQSDGQYADRIECYHGPTLLGSARMRERRRDVERNRPHAQGPDSGFIFKLPLEENFIPRSLHFAIAAGEQKDIFSATLNFSAQH